MEAMPGLVGFATESSFDPWRKCGTLGYIRRFCSRRKSGLGRKNVVMSQERIANKERDKAEGPKCCCSDDSRSTCQG